MSRVPKCSATERTAMAPPLCCSERARSVPSSMSLRRRQSRRAAWMVPARERGPDAGAVGERGGG